MKKLTEKDDIILNSKYELSAEEDENLFLFGEITLDLYLKNEWVNSNELKIKIIKIYYKSLNCEKEVRVGYVFYRHVLFYKNFLYVELINFLEKIIFDCKKSGLKVFDYIAEYFIIVPGGYVIYDPVTQDHWGVAKRNPQPTCTWRFLDVETIDPQSTDFDERIEVTVSWLDNRVRQEFKGYWYVTSDTFIDRHMAQHDPYYRRCMLISDTFNPEYVNQQLDLMMRYLATCPMEARIDCLKHHFEYDGQLMFYER